MAWSMRQKSAFKTLCFWRKTVNKKTAFTVKLREKIQELLENTDRKR
jgi:hypothetical protein